MNFKAPFLFELFFKKQHIFMDQKRNFASRRKSRDIPLAQQRKSLDYSGLLECNFYQFHLY